MDQNAVMQKAADILAEARTGILTTVDADGKPHARWMTPTLLNGRTRALYAVTSPHSAKAAHLAASPTAEWLLQTPALTEVLTVTGRVNVIDNPALKAEVIEAVGERLRVFWKVNPQQVDIVVLETVIESASFFLPMKGTRQVIEFAQETD